MTIRKITLALVLICKAVLGIAAFPAVADYQSNFVTPPLALDATMIVPESRMEGKGYKIDPLAINDGYVNTYKLSTEVGEVEAVSDYQLVRCIQEIRALIILDEMSRKGIFGDAMKNGVLAPFRGAKALVTAPVETTKGAIKGVGRWMGNIGRAIKSEDPYQEGGASAAVGWAGTRRAFALELGVDPYTDWEPLQKSLTSVARAAFAGGITAGVGMGSLTDGTTAGTVITVTSLSKDMNAILMDHPPEELTRFNREKLTAIGVSKDIVDSFLINYNYTPMEKSLMVESLRRMEGAKGREFFVTVAMKAPDRGVARYMQQRAEMMANYHNQIMATDIIRIEGLVWQINRSGTLVGVMPIDYLAWTENTFLIAAMVEENTRAAKREIWLEGSASPASCQALTARGWKVNERVGLLTGSPLQNHTAAGAGAAATSTVIKTVVP